MSITNDKYKKLDDFYLTEEQKKLLLKPHKDGMLLIAGTYSSLKESMIKVLAKEMEYNNFYFDEDSNYFHNISNSIIYSKSIVNKKAAKLLKDYSRNNYVLSPIHASGTMTIISRLDDFHLSIEDTNTHTLVYQNCLKKLCPYCKLNINGKLNTKQLNLLHQIEIHYPKISQDNLCFKGTGCEHCNEGFKDNIIGIEIVELNNKNLHYLQNLDIHDFYFYWKSLSDNNVLSTNPLGKTVREDCARKMFNGYINPEQFFNYYF